MYINLTAWLSIICVSACLIVCFSACLSVCLSACLSACLSDCLSVCLSLYLSVKRKLVSYFMRFPDETWHTCYLLLHASDKSKRVRFHLHIKAPNALNDLKNLYTIKHINHIQLGMQPETASLFCSVRKNKKTIFSLCTFSTYIPNSTLPH